MTLLTISGAGVKPLANTGTFVYNGKVDQGKEKSNPSDCVYLYLIIMKTKRSKQEQFVINLCHAFAEYGVNYFPIPREEEEVSKQFFRLCMNRAIDDNWNEIVELSKQLEFFYDN